MKVHIVFYSMFGHIYQMAEAVAEGAREQESNSGANNMIPSDNLHARFHLTKVVYNRRSCYNHWGLMREVCTPARLRGRPPG